MKEHSKPFLFIDLVKPALDCEVPSFGLYVLGPTNYDPEYVKGKEVLRLLCWDGSSRLIRANTPNVVDPFGPIFTPDLLARVWQWPRQDMLALNVEPSLADELSFSRTRYLTADTVRVISFVACLEWNQDAFVSTHELPKSPYQADPRYRATTERLRSKGIHEGMIKPDLRRDAIGIPVSICLRSSETLVEGIMMLQSEHPPVASVSLFIPHDNGGLVIEPGSSIEYRGKIVASVLRLEGSIECEKGSG